MSPIVPRLQVRVAVEGSEVVLRVPILFIEELESECQVGQRPRYYLRMVGSDGRIEVGLSVYKELWLAMESRG